MSGGDEVQINPNHVRGYAQGQREYGDQMSVPGRPGSAGSDWAAVDEYYDVVDQAGHHHRMLLHHRADGMLEAASAFEANEQSSASEVGQVGNGGGGKIDAAGFGSTMNAFLSPLGGLFQSVSGLGQGASQVLGQGVNVLGQMGAAATKGGAGTPAPGLVAGSGSGAGAGTPGADGNGGGQTQPAAATAPLAPGGTASGLKPNTSGDYARTEAQNHDDRVAQPAGMGGMGGLGGIGAGGSPSSPTTSTQKAKIWVNGQPPAQPQPDQQPAPPTTVAAPEPKEAENV